MNPDCPEIRVGALRAQMMNTDTEGTASHAVSFIWPGTWDPSWDACMRQWCLLGGRRVLKKFVSNYCNSTHQHHHSVRHRHGGMTMTFTWTPLEIHRSPYAVVLLNQPIKLPNFIKFWNAGKVAVSVDGGTNYLHHLLTNSSERIQNPHLIAGDFDSINKDNVLNFYKNLNVKIVHTPDQDHTDFTKALLELQKGIDSKEFCEVDRAIAIVETDGRLDHVFANFKTLFTPELTMPVFLLCKESLTWLLQPGKHSIHVDQAYIAKKFPCGIIPLCGPTLMVSTGLQWDLNDTYGFDVDSMVSTSNRIVNEVVEITTEKPTIWTMKSPEYNFE